MNAPELTTLAVNPWVAVLFFAWGFAEATVAPIVPDVGLGFLALATPATLGLPLAAAIAGGVAGALLLAVLLRRRPDTVNRMLAFQPGLGAAGMAEASRRISVRGGAAFAQVGPGLPLKAYVVAYLRERPDASMVTIAVLSLVNRCTRIVPVVAAFALLGALARPLDVDVRLAGVVYALGWSAFYAAFWWLRRSRGRPWQPL